MAIVNASGLPLNIVPSDINESNTVTEPLQANSAGREESVDPAGRNRNLIR